MLPVPQGANRWIALGDRRFLACAALIGVMSMQFEVLLFAAPLWIAKLGHAPRWTVSIPAARACCSSQTSPAIDTKP